MFRKINNQAGLALLLCIIAALVQTDKLLAQGTPVPGSPMTLNNTPQRDTSSKTNTSEWHNEDTKIYLKKLYTDKTFYPDTSIHTFHRRAFSEPFYRDLGNQGGPVRSMLFTPQQQIGPTLGYHVFDVYRFDPDSVFFYNTTRPYTSFTYQLGSKLEQLAEITHTQNISPRWNVAAQYRKMTSPGIYKVQRINNDNASLSTNYKSRNLHYELKGAVVYNKQQNDENGGIVSDTFLSDSRYTDRQTITVAFENDQYSVTRSSVTNVQRDFTTLLLHAYTWGHVDTSYNKDSTQYSVALAPRFSIAHRFEMSTEKFEFKDVLPDSLRYLPLFTGFTFFQGDSVVMKQFWFWTDNRLMLNGFLGKAEHPLKFTAGVGNRIDKFTTDYLTGSSHKNILSNYLYGELKKEAMQQGQWFYGGNTQLFLTGEAAGNFVLQASIGKELKKNLGDLSLGFKQQLHNAPYNYTIHQTAYDQIITDLNKESVTTLYANLNSPKFGLSAGFKNYVVNNYVYLDSNQRPDQFAGTINVSQVWLCKTFRIRSIVLDNELAFQQVAGSAPVNIPALLGRHQLSIETWLFAKALKVATGVQVQYHTDYFADSYSPFFNRFYYQERYKVSNIPQCGLFFNFKVKRFRAYLMGDQLQQFFWRNNINAQGYAAQNAMIRFGFNWIMIN